MHSAKGASQKFPKNIQTKNRRVIPPSTTNKDLTTNLNKFKYTTIKQLIWFYNIQSSFIQTFSRSNFFATTSLRFLIPNTSVS